MTIAVDFWLSAPGVIKTGTFLQPRRLRLGRRAVESRESGSPGLWGALTCAINGLARNCLKAKPKPAEAGFYITLPCQPRRKRLG